MTTIYFVRHAEPNYTNHDDILRELSEKGLRIENLLQTFLQINKLILYYPVHISERLIQYWILQKKTEKIYLL